MSAPGIVPSTQKCSTTVQGIYSCLICTLIATFLQSKYQHHHRFQIIADIHMAPQRERKGIYKKSSMKELACRKGCIQRPNKRIFLDIYIKYKLSHPKFLGVTVFMLGLLEIMIISIGGKSYDMLPSPVQCFTWLCVFARSNFEDFNLILLVLWCSNAHRKGKQLAQGHTVESRKTQL